jgi:hypothetical protein
MGRKKKYDMDLAEQLSKKFDLRPQTVIKAWREGREVKASQSTGGSKTRTKEIDLHLAVLASTNQGDTFTHDSIGSLCGCNGESIRRIEKNALKKLRKISAKFVN